MKYLLLLFYSCLSFSQNYEIKDLIFDISNFEQLEVLLPYLNDIEGIPSIFPIKENIEFFITSKYGIRNHPIEKKIKFHKGIDIAAEVGTLVIATASGIIDNIKMSEYGYGRSVLIKHEYNFKTQYSHLAIIFPNKGEKVEKGEVIGMVGNTGKSTGNHLHYEVLKNKIAIDPSDFFFLNHNFYNIK